MSKKPRPSLAKAFNRTAAALEVAPGEAVGDDTVTPPLFKGASKPTLTQINFRTTPRLKQKAKVKALKEGKNLQDVLNELLERWVRE
jgi:hypothetical protein